MTNRPNLYLALWVSSFILAHMVYSQNLNIRIDPQQKTAMIGETINLDVVIENVSNLGAFEFSIVYNSDVVHAGSAQVGAFPSSTGRTVIPVGPSIDNLSPSGKVTFGSASMGAAEGPNGSGVLAVVTFIAQAEGSTALDLQDIQVSDINGQNMTVNTLVPGEVNVSGTNTQTLDFNSGWNMFSINVIPPDPSMTILMNAVEASLKIVKNGAGQNYIPEYGINTIGDIDYLQGYQAYFNQAASLDVTGQPVDPMTPIALPQGWSMIAYLPSPAMDAATALVSINSQLVIAKNNAGQTYIPEYGINTIGDMHTGQGYQVYLKSAGTLTYPAGMLAKDRDPHLIPLLDHFTFMANTGENATLILPTTANPRYSDGTGLANGDEIGIFTTAGLCCGAVIWEGLNTAITVWGANSQTTETDGFTAGEPYHFRVWKQTANRAYLATARYQPEHPSTYGDNHYSVLTDLTADLSTRVDPGENVTLPSEFKLYANYPNPFNPETTIKFALPEAMDVSVSIYSLKGEMVERIFEGKKTAGLHTVIWNASDSPSGTYIIQWRADDVVQVQKCILMK